jgi:hypothetical protein
MHSIGAVLDVAQPHAGPEAHFADPVWRRGESGLQRLLHVGDARALVFGRQ